MRRLTDLLLGVTVVGLAAGAVVHSRKAATDEARVAATRSAVQRIETQIRLRAAAGEAEVNSRGWPTTIDPVWFDGAPPRNLLLKGRRPWLEIAPPEQADLQHPPVRVAVDETTASFWYNPGTGAVRARVPATVSDRRAVELYNRVNGASLRSIFEGAAPPQRPAADAVRDRLEDVDNTRRAQRSAQRNETQRTKPPR